MWWKRSSARLKLGCESLKKSATSNTLYRGDGRRVNGGNGTGGGRVGMGVLGTDGSSKGARVLEALSGVKMIGHIHGPGTGGGRDGMGVPGKHRAASIARQAWVLVFVLFIS